jgi:hypothetical protein
MAISSDQLAEWRAMTERTRTSLLELRERLESGDSEDVDERDVDEALQDLLDLDNALREAWLETLHEEARRVA